MFWYISVEPDITRLFNMVTGKNVILEAIFQKILDNAKSKVVISLCVSKNWTLQLVNFDVQEM